MSSGAVFSRQGRLAFEIEHQGRCTGPTGEGRPKAETQMSTCTGQPKLTLESKPEMSLEVRA